MSLLGADARQPLVLIPRALSQFPLFILHLILYGIKIFLPSKNVPSRLFMHAFLVFSIFGLTYG